MPTSKVFQNNFTSGEITPDLNARRDVKQYRNGVFNMTNAIPDLEGGVKRRPGSQYILPLYDETEEGKLIPFVFSATQAYMLVCNGGRFEYIIDRVPIISTLVQVITGAADNGAGAIRLTVTGHSFATGDHVLVSDVSGTVEANSYWVCTDAGANSIDLIGSSFSNTYIALGTPTISRLESDTSPYAEADLPNLRWAQDGDVLYLVDGTHIPTKITRTGATSFFVEDFAPNGPYNALNTSATTMTFSGSVFVGSSNVLTASTNTFAATDVGRVIKMGGDVDEVQGYLQITAYSTATQVTAVVKSTLSAVTATTSWALGAWNSVDGWPSQVTFHEQRLVLASTVSFPQTFWGSFLNAPDDFVGDAPTENDDSYSYKIRSETINTIEWMASLGSLLIGTIGEEFKVTGPTDTVIGPTATPLIQSQTRRGSSRVIPLIIDNLIMFVQWGGRRLYTLEFDPDRDDRLGGQDLTFISRHLIPDGTSLIRMAYEEQPNNIIWAVRSDGVMLSMVYFPEQEVLGWSQHNTLGGLYEDVAAVPNFALGISDTCTIMKRVVGGADRRFVEVFNRDLYVDSGLSGDFTPSPDTIINGLHHLVGEDVVTNLDGLNGGIYTIDDPGGFIDVSANYPSGVFVVQAGIIISPSITLLEQMPLTDQPDSVAGRAQRFGPVLIRTRNTRAFEVNGQSPAAGTTAGVGTQFIKDWKFQDSGHRTITSLVLTQPNVEPFHVLSVAGTVSMGDK